MRESSRSLMFVGTLLILLGILLSLFTFMPQLSFARGWPLIFILLAVGFFMPPFLWPKMRRGLGSLLIPGSIIAVLGLIFLYCSLTGDWPFWAFAWILLPAATGLGLLLAAAVGGWSTTVQWVGIWMAAISLVFYGLFALLFGSTTVQVTGALLVILMGGGLVIRSFIK